MPLVPHDPSDEPDEPNRLPDVDELVDRILRDGGRPSPTPGA